MMKIFIAAVAFFFAGALNAQWDTLNTGTGIKFNCVSFADATIGVVCGLNPSTDSGACGQIYITSNRGDNWFLLPFAAHEKNREIHDAAFTPEVQLWTVRDSGTVVLQHVWSVSYTSVSELSQYSLYCCFAVNDSVFYCAGENGIAFRTFDYGVTWDTMNSETTTNINDIYFADAANGWIVADGGYLAVTADSGSTWTFIP
ncbi:MAG TPA: YCF48-related protein, partial [Bacteroidia bacterium]|nr:YCF48-related protein [Bacteroidia bacterium]